MKKYFKRVGALLMAAIMTLAMCTTAFAADKNSTAEAKVTGIVQDGDSVVVTAYKLAELSQTSETGWAATTNGTGIADITNPTSTELKDLLTETLTDGIAMDKGTVYDVSGVKKADYTKALIPGMYLLKVTGTTTNYNPMVVSIGLQGEELVTTNASVEAKPESATIDKVAEDANKKTAHDLAIGDTVNFTVTSTIPTYGDEYKDIAVKYTITDTMSAGLTYGSDGKVTVSGVDEGDAGLPRVTADGQKLSVVFSPEFVKAHPGAVVTFTYSAKLNENAVSNFDPNTNEVELEYTKDTDENTDKVTDKTYHYTFEIDGELGGNSTVVTNEIIKTDEGTKESEESETVTYKRLEGAEFSLYTDEKCENEFAKAVSDGNGLINIKGLDGEVTYYLKETKAPSGYSLVSTPVTVIVHPNYNADGTLKDYKVVINGQETAKYSAVYTGGTTTVTEDKTDSYNFMNTKTVELPSTGGIGTYIFTIIGVLVMALAAGMFFVKRRKSAE